MNRAPLSWTLAALIALALSSALAAAPAQPIAGDLRTAVTASAPLAFLAEATPPAPTFLPLQGPAPQPAAFSCTACKTSCHQACVGTGCTCRATCLPNDCECTPVCP